MCRISIGLSNHNVVDASTSSHIMYPSDPPQSLQHPPEFFPPLNPQHPCQLPNCYTNQAVSSSSFTSMPPTINSQITSSPCVTLLILTIITDPITLLTGFLDRTAANGNSWSVVWMYNRAPRRRTSSSVFSCSRSKSMLSKSMSLEKGQRRVGELMRK